MMLRVCDLYYNRDMSQSEIAKIMDISRPTVARLLKSAKLRRIVEITISDPQQRRYSELEQRLEKMYKLQEVIIADTASTTNQQKDVLGKAAAGYLKSILKDDDVIGVGMGTTIRYIAPYAPRQFQNLTFIPLLGGSGNVDITLDANHVVDHLARAFCGEGQHLYVPAVVSHAQTKRTLFKEDSIRQIMEQYDHLDIALLGIGTADSTSSAFQSGYYSDQMKQRAVQDHVCGDICMYLFDRDGRTDQFPSNKQIIGVNLNKLKKVPYAIGIASGVRKAEAIRGAIKGGYINVLVTDAQCGEALTQLNE